MYLPRPHRISGHVISSRGIAPDLTKIEAMLDWLVPNNLNLLHGFWGLTAIIAVFTKITPLLHSI